VRRLAAVALIALATAGCEGEATRTPPLTPSPATSAGANSGGAPTTAGPGTRHSPVALTRIVLTANLGDQPSKWPLVAHIPFGRAPSELGLYHDREHTSTPLYPPSFAIGGDRSIWFLDIAKHRIAHYSPEGAYLGQVTGVRFARTTPVPRDLAFAGDRLYMLSQRAPIQGVVQSVGDEGVLPPYNVLTEHHHPAIVTFLYPTAGPLLGQVEGRSSRNGGVLGSGRQGVAELLGPRQDVRFLPGYPLVDGNFMDLRGVTHSDQDLELLYTSGRRRAKRPFHVRLVTGKGGRVIPAIVQFELDTGLPHGVVAVVGVGPAGHMDHRFGDGLWLFGSFDDGSPLIWERVPEAGLEQEFFHRSLTATPDGTIYRMIPEPDGIFIYRRPDRP